MNLRRIIPGLLVVLLTGGAIPVAAEEPTLPAACNGQAPAITEDEQLVERTLYFRGENRVGDVDGWSNITSAQQGPQVLSPDAPTGTDYKVDVNASSTVYPADLPGNPIMSAWHGYFDNTIRVACYSFNYWAIGDGSAMNVQLWRDMSFIVGEGTPVSASATTASGPGIAEYTAKVKPSEPLTIEFELFAQIQAATPASILYDSTDYPSRITLVTIEPKPTPTPEPTPTP